MTKALGAFIHIQQKSFSLKYLKIALWLACGSIPATIAGVWVVQTIRKWYGPAVNDLIIHTIGFTLLLVAVLMIIKPYIMRWLDHKKLEQQKQAALEGKTVPAEGTTKWETRYRPLVTVLVGLVVGFLVGLTSVGSGTLIIVALAFLFPRLSSKELVGADIVHAVMLHIAGTLAYFSAGTINWTIVMLLLIGSLPGVFLGSKLSKYMPDRIMRPILATVLVISGWKMI